MSRTAPALRRSVVPALLAAALVTLSATPAHAPHVAQLQVSPTTVRAGQEVTVFGPRGYARANPIEIRWNAPDGPVLGSFTANDELYAMWGPGTIRIPEDAKPGAYILYATQVVLPSENHIRGVPARAEIQVVSDGGAPILGEAPPTPLAEQDGPGLVEEDSVSTGAVLLVALGVAGLGMFAAGMAALAASRRRRHTAETAGGRGGLA